MFLERPVLSLITRQVQDFISGLVLGSLPGLVSSLVSSVVSIPIPSVVLGLVPYQILSYYLVFNEVNKSGIKYC